MLQSHLIFFSCHVSRSRSLWKTHGPLLCAKELELLTSAKGCQLAGEVRIGLPAHPETILGASLSLSQYTVSASGFPVGNPIQRNDPGGGFQGQNQLGRPGHPLGWVLAMQKSRASSSPRPPPGQQLPSSGFVISANCQALSIVCDFIVDIRLRQFSEWGRSQIVF